MYITRFLLIFVVIAFVLFFFWKTLLTTRYFQDPRRIKKILINTILTVLTLICTGLIIAIVLDL